ncbi:PREDICTED: uncharacterized protein LOC109477087 [Branchiostoma belcheri]|uniref:Uncharacterized protein LOC109477087 n=1 Tax=Branchiostoma belcheri TaxID=7741 RepID=A0A6P4ZVP0_BRABE|nr:PREDICTED: uncharacterized protein LOC109477087 [Branchiostoma belcheri]
MSLRAVNTSMLMPQALQNAMTDAMSTVDDVKLSKLSSIMRVTLDKARDKRQKAKPKPPQPVPVLVPCDCAWSWLMGPHMHLQYVFTGGRPQPEGARPPPKVSYFRTLLNELKLVSEVGELVFNVYEFAFDFVEWVLIKYLAENPEKQIAIKKACPVEWAKIDSKLTFVKEKMESIDQKFEEAMEIVEMAVNLDNDSETERALQRYKSIQSDIHPVFDTCIECLKKAEGVLETLNHKIEEMRKSYKDRATKITLFASIAAGVAGCRLEGMREKISIAALALVASLGCIGFAVRQRNELGNDLTYYNTKMNLIMEIDLRRRKLADGPPSKH